MNHNELRERLLKIIAAESDDTAWTVSNKHIMSLVKFYVEEEREACAKACEEYETANDIADTWLNIVSEVIRARGETTSRGKNDQ